MAKADQLVRVGIVMDLDKEKKRVRVYYPELSDMVSEWLYVLQRPSWGDEDMGGSPVGVSIGYAEGHTHSASVTAGAWYWMPDINDTVLVLYTPGFNTDGYVLGVIP